MRGRVKIRGSLMKKVLKVAWMCVRVIESSEKILLLILMLPKDYWIIG